MSETAGSTSPSALSDAQRRAWSDALVSLGKVIHAVKLLPDKHPAIAAAAAEAAELLTRALGAGTTGVVGVAGSDVLIRDEALPPSDALVALTSLLRNADIAGIKLHAPTAAQIAEFAAEFVRGLARGLKGREISESAAAASSRAIVLVPLDLSGVTFADLETGPQSKSASAWPAIVRVLLSETPPSDLARQADTQFAAEGVSAAARWQTQLHEVSRTIQDLGDAPGAELRGRLTSVVTALSPELRRSILQADSLKTGHALGLLAEVADGLPIAETVDALKSLEASPARPCREALLLCRKLARLARHDAGDREEFAQAFSRLSALIPPTPGSGSSISASMSEILQMRTSATFSPEDYTARLDELISGLDVAVAPHSDLPDFDEARTRLHAADIAGRMSAAPAPPGSDRSGVLRYLSTRLHDLLAAGRWETILGTARAAQDERRLHPEGPPRASAEGVLDHLTRPESVKLITRAAMDSAPCAEYAAALLRLGGADALKELMAHAGASPESKARVRSFARDSRPDDLAEAFVALARDDPGLLAAQIDLLTELPADRADAVIAPIMRSPHEPLRLSCVRVHGETPGPLADAALRAAVRDASAEVRREAVARLHLLRGESARPLLHACLRGEFGVELLTSRGVRTIVEAVLRDGEKGIGALSRTLVDLCRTTDPTLAAIAAHLADELGGSETHPGAAEALRAWRFSRARFAHFLSRIRRGRREAA